MTGDNVAARVWFHRCRSMAWMTVGALSFPLGWANQIVLVWVASLYANVASDWAAAEAADDRKITRRLDGIERLLRSRASRVRPARVVAVRRPRRMRSSRPAGRG